MASAFLGVLLTNLRPLIQKEIGLIIGVDDEMKKLASTLTTIQAVLADAEDKQFESEPIRDWLHKLNDLTYEIDDVVDECATEVSKLEHKNSILNRFSLKKNWNQWKIGKRMKEVTDKLDAVAAERAKFNLNAHDLSKLVERQSKIAAERETSLVLNEPDVFYGRYKQKKKIVDILVNDVRDSQKLSVLPILGIGGLGKTKLAQLVYKDSRVTEHFDIKLWVCVSDNFDIKTLVKAMIESATGSGSASDNLDALQRRLQELLTEKRYLLILDDVWNDNQAKWDVLIKVLACGSRGSSVIVTTRPQKVAVIMKALPEYRLSGLSEEHCWLLFRQYAFGQEMGKHPNLEAIGRQIVKKCGGVPLAAKALGGLLLFKREEKEWIHVKDSEILNFSKEENVILPALQLSYQHLPLQLRNCFSYCAVYPRDHEIEKKELIYCWMAHGYISSDGEKEVEDVGNEVWNELVLRSLFQDVSTDYYGKTTCKIHDHVHVLAQSIRENKIPGKEGASSYQSALNRNKIRQVNIKEQYVAFPRSLQKEVTISYTLQNYNRLRMLDASGTDMKDLPSEIGKLIHLRYLNLSNSLSLRTLPNTICSLWNLKILNLNGCYYLVSLPKKMKLMKNLSHLFLKGCNRLSEMPPEIMELSSLTNLFIVGSNQLDELQNLHVGAELEIRHLERVKYYHSDLKKVYIGEKSNLRDLSLKWEVSSASKQQQEMDEKVLEALEPHSNLLTLKISGFSGRYFPPWTKMENITTFISGVVQTVCVLHHWVICHVLKPWN